MNDLSMQTKKTAIIYARVSDRKQVENGLSIPSQIEKGREKAEQLDASVLKVFSDEGKSGTTDSRREFQAAIAFCEIYTPSYLILWSSSRFARNRFDAVMYKHRLDRIGTKIVYVTFDIDRDTPAGRIFDGLLELFDEHKSVQTSIDTKRSMVRNAKAGYWNGGRTPFGYRATPSSENPRRKRLEPHPDQSPIVMKIFNLKLAGNGAKSIASQLNIEGVSNRGNTWKKSTILDLLRNEAMIGNSVFGRKDRRTGKRRPRSEWIIVQSHVPTVPIDIWNKVQELMEGSLAINQGGTTKSRFVFTGILKCGRCGASMQMCSSSGYSKRYHYYNCRSAQQNGDCENRRIAAKDFDRWMIDVILEKIFIRDNLAELVRELGTVAGSWVSDRRQRRKSVIQKMEAINRKLVKLYELLEEHGKTTPDLGDLTKRLRMHNVSVKKLEQKLTTIDAEKEPVIGVSEADLKKLAEFLVGVIQNAKDPKKLREFFGSFINSIKIGKSDAVIKYDPAKLLDRTSDPVRSGVVWLPGTDSNCRQGD